VPAGSLLERTGQAQERFLFLVEEQVQRVFVIRVSLLKLRPGEPAGKRKGRLSHVHDTSLFLVDVRCVNHNSLEVFDRKCTCVVDWHRQ